MFTHCWTMRAWGWRWCIFLCSSVCCSFSLKAATSSGFMIRKMPLPWFRPVGLQIHMWLSALLTPANSHKDTPGKSTTNDIAGVVKSFSVWRRCGGHFSAKIFFCALWFNIISLGASFFFYLSLFHVRQREGFFYFLAFYLNVTIPKEKSNNLTFVLTMQPSHVAAFDL